MRNLSVSGTVHALMLWTSVKTVVVSMILSKRRLASLTASCLKCTASFYKTYASMVSCLMLWFWILTSFFFFKNCSWLSKVLLSMFELVQNRLKIKSSINLHYIAVKTFLLFPPSCSHLYQLGSHSSTDKLFEKMIQTHCICRHTNLTPNKKLKCLNRKLR